MLTRLIQAETEGQAIQDRVQFAPRTQWGRRRTAGVTQQLWACVLGVPGDHIKVDKHLAVGQIWQSHTFHKHIDVIILNPVATFNIPYGM